MRGALRVATAAGVFGVVGCTSILGDFSAKDAGTGAPPPDAHASSPPDASGSPSDAGDAGDAKGGEGGGGQLLCTTWLWSQPVVVEDLVNASSKTFSGRFVVFPGDTNEVRIVAAKTTSPAFSVYVVNTSSMQVQQLDAPISDGGGALPFVSMIRHVSAAQGGTTAVVVGQKSPGPTGPTTAYTVTAMSDLMTPTALPAAFPLLAGVTSSDLIDDMGVLPFSTTDIFEAVSIGSGNPPNYTLGVTRVSPTAAPVSPSMLATIATSPNAGDFSSIRLLHTNGSVYVYDLNDPSTPGTTGWMVPDTAIVASAPAKQVVASGQNVGVIGLSPNTAAPAAEVFMVEQDFSGQFTSGFKYYVGTVDFTALSSWTEGSLTKLNRNSSPFAAPFFLASPANQIAAWFDDNTMLLGPGLRNGVTDAGPGPGLNLLWVSANGNIRADQAGLNEILNDRANFVWAGAVPAHVSATSATWNVVWVEAVTSVTGTVHDVMRMNQLQCQ
jgi:hypothetical protein